MRVHTHNAFGEVANDIAVLDTMSVDYVSMEALGKGTKGHLSNSAVPNLMSSPVFGLEEKAPMVDCGAAQLN